MAAPRNNPQQQTQAQAQSRQQTQAQAPPPPPAKQPELMQAPPTGGLGPVGSAGVEGHQGNVGPSGPPDFPLPPSGSGVMIVMHPASAAHTIWTESDPVSTPYAGPVAMEPALPAPPAPVVAPRTRVKISDRNDRYKGYTGYVSADPMLLSVEALRQPTESEDAFLKRMEKEKRPFLQESLEVEFDDGTGLTAYVRPENLIPIE